MFLECPIPSMSPGILLTPSVLAFVTLYRGLLCSSLPLQQRVGWGMLTKIHSFIHSFTYEPYSETLLDASPCAGSWGNRSMHPTL